MCAAFQYLTKYVRSNNFFQTMEHSEISIIKNINAYSVRFSFFFFSFFSKIPTLDECNVFFVPRVYSRSTTEYKLR